MATLPRTKTGESVLMEKFVHVTAEFLHELYVQIAALKLENSELLKQLADLTERIVS